MRIRLDFVDLFDMVNETIKLRNPFSTRTLPFSSSSTLTCPISDQCFIILQVYALFNDAIVMDEKLETEFLLFFDFLTRWIKCKMQNAKCVLAPLLVHLPTCPPAHLSTLFSFLSILSFYPPHYQYYDCYYFIMPIIPIKYNTTSMDANIWPWHDRC